MSHPTLLKALVLCFAISQIAMAAEEQPLHQRVDTLVAARDVGPVAPRADDATFLRRATLSLIGRIPTRTELEAFLSDESPDKREQLVDRLLGSPDYARHMAIVFDLMLMERRGGKHVKSPEFRTYLEEAFLENRPFNVLAQQLLAADGTDERIRPAAAFYLEREVEPHLLTRDVGRIFFGVDLQCAQCHDHPLIDDYHQADYYGLNAFFVRASLFQPDRKKPALLAETAEGEANFKSVFTDREGMLRPRVPGGDELLEVSLKPTEHYEVAPAKNVRPVPKYSRLAKLAEQVAASPSPAFNRNIVNRLWAHMMGRGLVHPVDLHHSGNPPTHPQVLDLLATEFAAHNYDIRWMLRELALTEVYQRAYQVPGLKPSIDDARQRITEVEAASKEASERSGEAESQVWTLIETLDAAVGEAKPFRDAEAAAAKKVKDAAKARDEAKSKVDARVAGIAKQTGIHELLTTSVTATKAVTESLSEDKEVAAALATLQKKADSQQAAIQKLEEALKGEQTTLATAEKTLSEATAAADQAIAARAPHEKKVLDLRKQVFAARETANTLRTEAQLAERDADYLRTLIAYGETQQKIAGLQQSITQTEANITAAAELVAKATEQVKGLETKVAQAQTTSQMRQQALKVAMTELERHRKTQSQLATAIENAQSASASIPSEEGLTTAVTLLTTSAGVVATKVESATANVKQHKQEAEAAKQTATAAQTELTAAQQSLAGERKKHADLQSKLASTRTELAATKESLDSTWDTLVEQSASRFNAAPLTPLTPEQFALSLLIATGQYERQRAASKAKLDKEKPLAEDAAKDPAALAQREREIDEATFAALAGTLSKFAGLYGAGSGQPQQGFFATVEQSLFLSNGGELRAWLSPSGENLAARLVKTEDPSSLARELYLSILSRQPTDPEIHDVTEYLQTRADQKPAAVQELAWALLTSAEFRFLH